MNKVLRQVLTYIAAFIAAMFAIACIYVSIYTVARESIYKEITAERHVTAQKGPDVLAKYSALSDSLATEQKLLQHSQETYDYFIRILTFLLSIWSVTITMAAFYGYRNMRDYFTEQIKSGIAAESKREKQHFKALIETPLGDLRSEVAKLRDDIELLVVLNKLKPPPQKKEATDDTQDNIFEQES